MPHDLAELFAELDAAKAGLQRSVRRTSAFLAGRRAPAEPTSDRKLFDWSANKPR